MFGHTNVIKKYNHTTQRLRKEAETEKEKEKEIEMVQEGNLNHDKKVKLNDNFINFAPYLKKKVLYDFLLSSF